MTFLVPFLIFGLGAIGNLLIQQRFDDASSSARLRLFDGAGEHPCVFLTIRFASHLSLPISRT